MAMDGAVMEGPLFLQSQRFGTKVVAGAGGAEPHQSYGGRKSGGRAAGRSVAPGAREPYIAPAKLLMHTSEGAPAGLGVHCLWSWGDGAAGSLQPQIS